MTGGEEGRRPIAVRDLAWFHHAAAGLARRGVSANMISGSSMVFAAAVAAALVATASLAPGGLPERLCWAAVVVGIELRLLANLLDGLVAVEMGKRSPTGGLWNEVPDRIADLLILGGAGYAAGSSPALGFLAGAIAVLTAYVREIGARLGGGAHFQGPMAKPHRMHLLAMVCLVLAALPSAWRPEPGGLGLLGITLVVIILLSLLTALRRLAAAARQIRAHHARGGETNA